MPLPLVAPEWVLTRHGRLIKAGYAGGRVVSLVKPLAPVLILLIAFVGWFVVIFQYGYSSPIEIVTMRLLGFALAGLMVGWGVLRIWGAWHEG